MRDQYLRTAIAGIFFGFWPIFMNRSGLRGSIAAVIFCLTALAITTPFALKDFGSFSTTNWTMAITAGLFGGIGLLFFNSMLVKASPKNVGTLFIIMLMTQLAVPAIFQVTKDGGITFYKGLGFITAIATVLLLSI